MRRAAAALLSLAFVAVNATAALSSTPLPSGYKVVVAANMYQGVDYVKLKKPNVPVTAHVARILPDAPVDFRVVDANDKVSTSARDLELTSSICGGVHCVVGVNGDFHKLGIPAGGIVSDGRLLRSPDPGRAQLTVTTDGKLTAGLFAWSGTLTAADGTRLPIAAVNTAPPANGISLYTLDYGKNTESSVRTELVVTAPASIGSLNKAIDVEMTGLRVGSGPIPAGSAVLSADGLAAQQLADLWSRKGAGMAPGIRLQLNSPLSASASLGVEPVVLRDGARAPGWRDPNLIVPRQPHTLIGWNKAGETYLVAVDGRSTESDGVTMAEAADFLLGLGATDAVSLDGGGGTTFAAGRSVWNRPSDGSERGAVNAFVVTAKPGFPLPPAAPPKPAPPEAPSGSPGTTGTPGSTGTPGTTGTPGSGGGGVTPGTITGTGSGSNPWPTSTNGSTSWPTPGEIIGLAPGATSGLAGRPTPTVVVNPASAAGSRALPGVAGPRLVLIDPPASDAPAEEAPLATTSDSVTKRAGRKKSTTTTADNPSGMAFAGPATADHGSSLNWAMGLRGVAALGIGSCTGALLVVRRRLLLSF